MRTFSDSEAGLFRSLLKARHDHVLDPDSRFPRPHKKELTAGLVQAGISHSMDLADSLVSLGVIGLAAGKATDFVKGLQRFINREIGPQEPKPVDPVESLETILLLFRHQMLNRIRIVRKIDSRPEVLGHPDQILEIWSNLVQNAIHAVEGGGDLKISIRPRDPPDLQEKIF